MQNSKLLCCLFLGIFLLSILQLSAQNRWSVGVFGGHNVRSAAITNPVGLSHEFGGKYWGGLNVGFDFISKRNNHMALSLGAAYRDYGFNENKSSIPYATGLAYLHLKHRLFWRIWMSAYGGGEYGKLLESQYKYANPGAGTNDHNLFLHQNDVIAVSYGGGLALSFGRFWLNLGFEKNLQMDTYDLQYGKTVGGQFSNVTLQYYLF